MKNIVVICAVVVMVGGLFTVGADIAEENYHAATWAGISVAWCFNYLLLAWSWE